MIKDMEEAMNGIQLEISIRVNFSLERQVAWGNIHGFNLVKYTMASGSKESDMVWELGGESKSIPRLASLIPMLGVGSMVRLMVMEFILGVAATNTKVSGKCA